MSFFDEHLCSYDPKGWEQGFNDAAEWVRSEALPGEAWEVFEHVRTARDGLFPAWLTVGGERVKLSINAYDEGWMLGVYGEVSTLGGAGP